VDERQEAEVEDDEERDWVIGVYSGHRNARTVKVRLFSGA
jgi:hypothetical protein